MTERIQTLLNRLNRHEHRKLRKPFDLAWMTEFRDPRLSHTERVVKRLCTVLKHDDPAVSTDQKIVFQHTLCDIPTTFAAEETEELKKTHFIHELGYVSNISPNYERILNSGFDGVRAELEPRLARCKEEGDTEGILLLQAMSDEMDAICAFTAKYRAEAERVGNTFVADNLKNIPAKPATTFAEALQMFRIVHFMLWAEGEYHNTVGRFDQYMMPFLQNDLDRGLLTEDEAFELLEEFFITFNLDSDMYPGVQQGDDGQSMMLAGFDKDGNYLYNKLTVMCMRASCELLLIDPKINLRVGKNTPLECYTEGTRLTKAGLGFPQYSNDDVVIPGLIAKGYAPEDAYNYTVAACWEFIIPATAMDVVNIGAVSMPKLVLDTLNHDAETCDTFDRFLACLKTRMQKEADTLADSLHDLYFYPAPFMSIVMDGCIERARDISTGSKYNNFGFHGTGISTAADSLANIKKYIYDEKSLSVQTLKDALAADFNGYEELLAKLRFKSPKMGGDAPEADEMCSILLDNFADVLANKKNERGGVFRAGTGSAMFYLRHAEAITATPDGRRKDEPFAANFSPSIFYKTHGPMAVIDSFTHYDFRKTINGGPLTIEFHSEIFRSEENLQKVAAFVKTYIDMGGHQMQLNAINRAVLEDARLHPENHQGLIVRIWGWSAYFCELDDEYKDHVIRRQEYGHDIPMHA